MTANTTAAVDAPRGCDEVAFLFEGGAGVVEAGVEHGHPVVRADAVPRDVDATVSTHRKLRAADARKLRADYEKRYEAQFGLRMQAATQQMTNTSGFRRVRRDIARVKTVLTQKDARK